MKALKFIIRFAPQLLAVALILHTYSMFLSLKEMEESRDVDDSTRISINIHRIEPLKGDHRFMIYQPMENHTGLFVSPELELNNPGFRHLLVMEKPWIRSGVRLSNRILILFGFHLRPPVMQPPDAEEDPEREESDGHDAELLFVGREVRKFGNMYETSTACSPARLVGFDWKGGHPDVSPA
ncbi:MAG: hypothetical protein JJU29_02020 [Verrucomicrobia bacterium]|nr:hypothetical protein [Verrucomicrobiota bacterium]MCH8512040.1 hypothetical protein [Kiritimatiellia bacterium]